jgi:hypothetical protein
MVTGRHTRCLAYIRDAGETVQSYDSLVRTDTDTVVVAAWLAEHTWASSRTLQRPSAELLPSTPNLVASRL